MTIAWPPGGHLLLATLLAVIVSFAAHRARALSPSGALAAAFVGFLIFGLGGTAAATALLLFFVSSSTLSRWRRREKQRLAFENGGDRRDAGQVLANGGVAAICALLVPLFPGTAWPLAALLGALSAANADTWATEIGSLARHPPRLLTTLRPAPPGASGAVSLPGTLAALAGALLVSLIALATGAGAAGLIAATLGGFLGALVDSLLGATLQVQYRCAACGALTERRLHCAGHPPARAERGLPWIGNDAVNFAATATGAALATVLYLVAQQMPAPY